jgi:carbonic anhydrase
MVKNQVLISFCGAALFASITSPVFASEEAPPVAPAAAPAHATASCTPEEALERLKEGNKRYVENRLEVCKDTTPKLREELAKGQHPFAVVLSCSDSRLPPEIIFDKKPGELFVVRVAGNVVDPVNLASIEYALEHLGAGLILVLGHERCGAVTAAYDTFSGGVKRKHKAAAEPEAEGDEKEERVGRARKKLSNMDQLLNTIRPAVVAVNKKKDSRYSKGEMIEMAIDENVRNVTKNITKQSAVIRKLVEENKVRIVSGKFDLDDGTVRIMGRKECTWVND